MTEDVVPDILLHNVIVNKNAQKAEELLLNLPGLCKYVQRLKTSREKEDFKRHMRKYINLWLPDCPFEVSTTNRYTILTQEAAITARKYIKQGDVIKYLSGNLVPITPEEEKDLDLTRRDFSIVMSSRKKTPSLFLGPARFANHDCNANAKLVTRGFEGMGVVALRSIDIGEEVTVTYGNDYFGERNCECLCKTCEEEARNGWAPRKQDRTISGTSTPGLEAVEEKGPYAFRRKRKYGLTSDLIASSTTPEIAEAPAFKKAKHDGSELGAIASITLSVPEVGLGGELNAARRGSWLSQSSTISNDGFSYGDESNFGDKKTVSIFELSQPNEEPDQTLEALDPMGRGLSPPGCSKAENSYTEMVAVTLPTETAGLTGVHCNEPPMADAKEVNAIGATAQHPRSRPLDLPSLEESSRANGRPVSVFTDSSSPPFSGMGDSQPSNLWTDASSVADEVLYTHKQTVTAIPDFSGIQDTIVVGGVAAVEKGSLEAGLERSESELSELSEGVEFDDKSMTVTRRGHRLKKWARKPKVVPSIEPQVPEIRYQGDYLRTPLLLGESYSRWVDCTTCKSCWVQSNSYCTRKECPRCERHSKLYGYRWPKTDKEGRGDEEERVMDHRTVHRFFRHEEEAKIKKRGKGLHRSSSGMAPPEGSSRSGSEAIDIAKSRRKVGRPRKSRLNS